MNLYLVDCPGEVSLSVPLEGVSIGIHVHPDKLDSFLAASCIITIHMATYGICVEQHGFALFFVLRYLRYCSTLCWHQENRRHRTVMSFVWT